MSYSRGTLIKTLWWLNLLHSFTHPTHLLSTYVPSTVHNRMNKENVVSFAKSSPFSGETYIKQTVAQSVFVGTSLVVQRLGLCASTTEGIGLIRGQGINIPCATLCSQNTTTTKKLKKSIFVLFYIRRYV